MSALQKLVLMPVDSLLYATPTRLSGLRAGATMAVLLRGSRLWRRKEPDSADISSRPSKWPFIAPYHLGE